MSTMERTCRTCGKSFELNDNTILFPLYNAIDYETEMKITLEECDMWNLDISQNDGLPQKICATCLDSFCQIHNFRSLCIEAQMNFGEMCTGLDIFIKDEMNDEDCDFVDNVDVEESVIVQEYYSFPGDDNLKSSSPLLSDLPENIKKPHTSEAENIVNHQEDLEENNIVDTESKVYQCEFCMDIVSFDDPDEMNEHYNKLHSSDLPYTCPKCDKCFETKLKRNTHARTHNRIVVDCKKCGKKVRGGNRMLVQHNEYNHVEKDRECSTCGKLFKSISLKRFNYHLGWHDDTKLHKCKYCEKKFIQTTHLILHERTHAGGNTFKCNQCGLGFKNWNLLSKHVQMHGENDIKCSQCPKKFFNAAALDLHTKSHNAGKKYSHCEICNMTYRSTMNFRLHNYKRHNAPATESMLNVLKKRAIKQPIIKPFKCRECPQAFVLHTQLIKHLKVHDEVRPFSCEVCLKTFKRVAHLNLHVNSLHLNKKPHKCTICGWAFPQRNNLKEHIAAKHETNRDFKCELCPKEFATSKSLKLHKVLHSEKTPYVCTVCNRSFKLLSALKNHMIRHLRKNEADIEGGDITDIVVEDELKND